MESLEQQIKDFIHFFGFTPFNIETLQDIIGIDKEPIKEVIDRMIFEGKIKEISNSMYLKSTIKEKPKINVVPIRTKEQKQEFKLKRVEKQFNFTIQRHIEMVIYSKVISEISIINKKLKYKESILEYIEFMKKNDYLIVCDHFGSHPIYTKVNMFRLVMNLVIKNQNCTRTELADLIRISQLSLHKILVKLQDLNLINKDNHRFKTKYKSIYDINLDWNKL